MSNDRFSSNTNTNSNLTWNQSHQIEYSNSFRTSKTHHQQDQNQSHPLWINSTHPLARHRHHHSLDSSFIPSNPNQPSNQQQQQQQFLSVIPGSKRSSSLSIDQNHLLKPADSSSSTSFNYPTDDPSSNSNRIVLNYHQPNKPAAKRSQSKLSLVTAIPASILKKDKPGLLSQEQKRANHIASEQKRRAAIRQGYSRLCLIVPSLRSTLGGRGEDRGGGGPPIRSSVPKRSDDDSPFDEQASLLSSTFILNQDGSNSSTTSPVAFKRKRNKQLPFESNRPAPRSEAVVLAKTVEYLRELKSERNLFLEKLQRLRMIAISKGVQISYSHRQQHHDHADTTRLPKKDLDDGTDHHEEGPVEQESRLEVWEDKWRGNIHQVDLNLNNLPHHHDLKRDHQNMQILDFSIPSNLHQSSPPTPTTTSTIEFIQNPSVY